MSDGKETKETKVAAAPDAAAPDAADGVERLHLLFPHNTGRWNSLLFKKNDSGSPLTELSGKKKSKGSLETFISLKIQEDDCVFPYEGVKEHIKAFWKLPLRKTSNRTCGMIM